MQESVSNFRSILRTNLQKLNQQEITIDQCELEVVASVVDLLVAGGRISGRNGSATDFHPSPDPSLPMSSDGEETSTPAPTVLQKKETAPLEDRYSSHSTPTPHQEGEFEGEVENGRSGRSSRKIDPESAYSRARSIYRRYVGKSIGQLKFKQSQWNALVDEYGDAVVAAVAAWSRDIGKRGRNLGYPLAVFLSQCKPYIDEAMDAAAGVPVEEYDAPEEADPDEEAIKATRKRLEEERRGR